jgi:transposase
LSKFVVCTDAGLSSYDNRKYNDFGERAFVTTQSIKTLAGFLKDWALDPEGWSLPDDERVYNIEKLDEEAHKKSTFYKEREIVENGLDQRLIVTYSIKHRDYQRQIRQSQIERAEKAIANNPKKLGKSSQNDYKRLIRKTKVTADGEIAEKEVYRIDEDIIAKEASFDGFYGLCTNLGDKVPDIIRVNHRRWEIEECFRIMKSEFKARPVYLSDDDRIKAHFTTCFMALTLYRLLEKKLGEKYTCREIINGLRDMNFYEAGSEGYIPTYTRTDFTDDLHEAFGFRTDYQIVGKGQMKKIFKGTKI